MTLDDDVNRAADDGGHLGFLGYDDAIEQTLTPLWREARWGLEWAQLRWSPVYYGYGVPHGHGEPVLLIPGFMSGDLLMLEMHRWLKRIGYRSSLSRIAWNNDCPDQTGRKLGHRVRRLADRHGSRVRLVGHSLGGMLARSLVQEMPEYVDRVVTLGSPFRSLVKAHPAVIGIWDKLKLAQGGLIGRNLHASCGTGHCTCAFVRNMSMPRTVDVPQYAVYSRRDGVADWSSCIERDPRLNTEVNCSHIGMVFHAGVYRAVAARLAQRQRHPHTNETDQGEEER
ncbi:MAG: lipase family alpha/beta hydrolase [Gammaproteobacteria bacterium]